MVSKLFTILLLSLLMVVGAFGAASLLTKPLASVQKGYDKLSSDASKLTNTPNVLPSISFSFLSKLLDCFGLQEIKAAIESFVEQSDFPSNIIFNNSFINGTTNVNDITPKDGFFGNGQMACGFWVGNVTELSYTCILNGDQSFGENQLLNGNQTLFCGELSNNYVQFLNGFFKLYMRNTKEVPFDGYIDLGPAGVARGTFSKDGFIMQFPRNILTIQFNRNENSSAVSA